MKKLLLILTMSFFTANVFAVNADLCAEDRTEGKIEDTKIDTNDTKKESTTVIEKTGG